ncbi:TIGR04283 family arsenosugar biosynthesis glycosyltransferase [Maribacter sp. 2210JD10-5]|uniref:TIGR04283 family arsenosugar biosynthesis glycosyltransferase n=1 Tax=Maribacter sp. 2210JD10-5 TaxID=3386272 RepID=UPI0039BD8CF4
MNRSVPKISIIIPVLNEAAYIKKVLFSIQEHSSSGQIAEILVIDGGSTDDTIKEARSFGVTVVSSPKGRGKQMNLGARLAKGDILYFLHVDTLPPAAFDRSILKAYSDGYQVGCFQMKFDSRSLFLRVFSWFTKLNHKICRGGDQSLFITKKLFEKAGGFNEDYKIYEDNEFIGRIYKMSPFKILPEYVRTSARRYEEKGMVSLQCHFGVIHLKHYFGAAPDDLYQYYKRKIAT